jgi:transposase-like protein
MDKDATRQGDKTGARSVPDPEVDAKPRRRTFSAEYKLKLLMEVDACGDEGEVGAILRREGLYASHLKTWRNQRDVGALRELGKRRGRHPKRQDKEVERVQRENVRLKQENAQLRQIVAIQKKASELFGMALASAEVIERS